MEAVQTMLHKVMGLVMIAAILLTLIGAISYVYSEDKHIFLSNTKNIALTRDAALASPYQLDNYTLVIPTALHLESQLQTTCLIGFSEINTSRRPGKIWDTVCRCTHCRATRWQDFGRAQARLP